jgi:hypoxanthine phosphoribosyltransferase
VTHSQTEFDLPPFPGVGDIGEVLLTEDQITSRVRELGLELARKYADHTPLFVAVMKGSVIFAADLLRAYPGPVQFDVMIVSSYGDALETSGVVKIVKDLDTSAAGRHVVLIEDIVDTGLTMAYLLNHFKKQGAASVSVCSLTVREGRAAKPAVDHVGFEIPHDFVIGYGLDAAQLYRNLPYIAVFTGTVDGH